MGREIVRKNYMTLEEKRALEKKEREEYRKVIFDGLKTPSDAEDFLNKIKGKNSVQLMKILDILDEGGYKKLIQKIKTEENINQVRTGMLNWEEFEIRCMLQEIEDILFANVKIKDVDRNLRNRAAKQRRNKNREIRKMEERASSLREQVEDIFSSTNYRSSSCRKRYRKCCLRFVDWIAEQYKLQKISNLREDQLVEYVHYMSEIGYSRATARTEIYGVFFMMEYLKMKNTITKNKITGEINKIWVNRK